jgi:anti-anti-sigma factor
MPDTNLQDAAARPVQTTMATSKDKKARIKPPGDISDGGAEELRVTMRGALEKGARIVTVDLSKVKVIDSGGLGVLAAAHNSLHAIGGRVSVVHPSADVTELLRTLRIHHHFGLSGE